VNIIEKSMRECERWGVEVRAIAGHPAWVGIRHDPDNASLTHSAPFTQGGIHLTDDGPVIYTDIAPTDDVTGTGEGSLSFRAMSLIHELGHCLNFLVTGKDPAHQKEADFIALDLAMCRVIRGDWLDWMSEYHVDETMPWPDACIATRRHFLARSRRWCSNRGLLLNGTPTYEIRHREFAI
jgi:hypothetical protein